MSKLSYKWSGQVSQSMSRSCGNQNMSRKVLGEKNIWCKPQGWITIRWTHSEYYSDGGRTIFQKVQTVKKIHLKIEDNPFHPFATLHTEVTQERWKIKSEEGHLELLLGDAIVSVGPELLAADVLDRLELRAEEEAGGSQQLERALWYPGRRWVKMFVYCL